MGKRYSEADKVRAWELHCEGKTYQEIADEIGCSIDLIKRSWSKKWKARKAEVVEKVMKEAEYVRETTVAIEKMELDHLMALRRQYYALRSTIVDADLTTMKTQDVIALFREMRETLMASAKLEGVEPPQKNLNINVHTDMKSLKERMKQYEGLFDG